MANPPKPTELRMLQGNPGKRAINKDEPQLGRVLIKCPDRYDAKSYEREAWEMFAPVLYDMGVLTEADKGAVILLAEAWADYRNARDKLYVPDILNGGLYYDPTVECTGDKGQTYVKTKAEVAITSDAWRRVQAILNNFGLTPSARTKVKAVFDKPDDPMEALRKRKKGGK